MQKVKSILYKINSLLVDIYRLGYNIIRQIVLPSGKRKGNLLSSLFILTIGIVDSLIVFEQNILRTPKIFSILFRNRHIKQGLKIATAILLIIYAFEWSGAKVAYSIGISTFSINASHQETNCDTYLLTDHQVLKVNEGKVFPQNVGSNLHNYFTALNCQSSLEVDYSYPLPNSRQFRTGKQKIFLFNSSLLI